MKIEIENYSHDLSQNLLSDKKSQNLSLISLIRLAKVYRIEYLLRISLISKLDFI